ncbi:hypothetical protein B0T17DRAFT_481064 [Bombardia bombarda]|uniref:Bet v1-like protein n=1 Tax=Bombardia bombarda TaxID=252184 RepID=A0AA39XM63_9PEZI|nr:hypothetical protein B0T17DRAFT_481064 [Bombardia bombarda]
MATIATTNEVIESAVIRAPLSNVWHFLKIGEFDKFWPALKSCEPVKGYIDEANVTQWTYQDDTIVNVKLDEHSSIDHFITYSIITAEPSLGYSSVTNTIRCWPVTHGELENSTFVRWSSKFSSDAGIEVIEDAKYKRREALSYLSVAAMHMATARQEHQK